MRVDCSRCVCPLESVTTWPERWIWKQRHPHAVHLRLRISLIVDVDGWLLLAIPILLWMALYVMRLAA